nr:Chain B, Fusion glycoprotein F0 [Human respiratory syncytial virus A2]
VFPSDEFDASISQVNEKINQSLAFIRKSDELLHNVNAGK